MQFDPTARRRFVRLLGASALALGAVVPAAWAQAPAWPDKPLKLLVGFPAGGASDLMARLVADRLGAALGQPVVVDNRPGAAGTLAASLAAKAAPDGYTLLLASPTAITLAPTTMAGKLSYDPVRDLAPITMVNRYPLILVANPQLGVKTFPEFLAKARAQPGKINFGSFGANTSGGLATEMIKLMGKVDVLHVPFNGGAPATQALLGGTVDLSFDTVVTALGNVKAGKLVPLAVSGAKRTTLAPDLPTVAETLPGFEADSWTGLMAPAGTPPPVIARIQSEVAKMLASPEIRERFAGMGAEGVGNRPEEFAAYLREETARYAKLVREANLKLD
ncbi:MAG: tripartite tricarboxylate transporter substrate binding protein [Betaproteobacteria bacterium]|nr:tripartite tricarboxylate transporter substrate binding protein [Betaproteobacteria bacterium]